MIKTKTLNDIISEPNSNRLEERQPQPNIEGGSSIMSNFIGLFGNNQSEPHSALPMQQKPSIEMRKRSSNNQQDGKFQVKSKSPKFTSSNN